MLQDNVIGDHVVIRGRRLNLSDHVDRRLFDPAYVDEMRERLSRAQPFPHLVVSGWFNPVLLELVREEFDLLDKNAWRVFRTEQERTRRSTPQQRLGPASEIYFSIVNSGWFLDLLADISGHEDLVADPKLLGGGLHETPPGGTFGIHRDFDVHARHGLDNKMVFITYLNKGWDPAWGAALELWRADPSECVHKIQPEFGTSILMIHGPASFHGHPQPMAAPEGQTRRSVATYYYQNRAAVQARFKRVSTVFLVAHRSKRLRYTVSRWLPPVLLDAIKRWVSR